jgi:hypothetical protein
MSVQYSPPVPKRLVFYFDGTQSRFQFQINYPIKESISVGLRAFTVAGTPVTATIPDTPVLRVRFENTGGFNINPQLSSFSEVDEIVLTLDGAITQTTYTPVMNIGTMMGGLRQHFLVNVADIAGVPHHATTNALFTYFVLELEVMETKMLTNPNWLLKVPTIQQTLDTI